MMTTTRETSTRLIDVDDANALISYQGTWHWGTKYSVNTQWGSAWYNSLSVLSGNGSVAFSFTGVTVIGSFHASKLPSWTCYLDGNAFPSNNISLSVDLNNVEICSSKNLALEDTPRHLAVVASGTVDTPFMFDHIQYEPDASIILDNATVVVDAFDVHIEYSSGWSSASDIGMETSVQGSFLNFDFVGTQITWVTTVALNSNITLNASAQYSIDNGTLFPFTVFAQNSTVKQYNIASFDSPILSPGLHRLFVQYGVDNVNSSAPLFLDYLLIQNVTGPLIPPNTTTMATTQRPTGTPGPVFYRAGLSKGAITGVAVGSVAGLVLITFGLIWTIRFVKTAASLREPVPYIIYRDVRNLWRTKELNSTALTARGAFI